ncbi:MAG: hypothetical protein IIW97_05910 [Alistipes sp.]|jgi:hypothetical protein|nr:hypothetical protein [Alistipes sp.]MBQ5924856.1 hypothetical protein [Alistipes sp.]
MDIVITYVDGLDPVWQKSYEQYTNTPILEKRFRDWGTLKYLFRGIEKNMPFIRKVHLVVSGETQVPAWVNRDEVDVVLHSDIIPQEYLPTFNCNPIEMHLHRIKDLDEEFLYFNDDMFPMKECKPTDFFRDGKGVIRVSYHLLALDMFKQICRNSTRAAREALGLRPTFYFMRPQHICSPMFKSECEELYDKVEPVIRNSISRVRTGENLNQYLFLDYMYLKGKIINERISKKHFSVGVVSASKLRKFITQPTHKMACINDVQLTEERYEELRRVQIEAFEELFPKKSKFEK